MALALVLVALYFVPSLLAIGKRGAAGIVALNILLGWTFVGWVIALVWALAAERKAIETVAGNSQHRYISVDPQSNAKHRWREAEVRGESFANPDGTQRQDIIAQLQVGEEVQLRRDPKNAFDANCIAVVSRLGIIGNIAKERAADLGPEMDAGQRFEARIRNIAGGHDDAPSRGVWIEYRRVNDVPPSSAASGPSGRP